MYEHKTKRITADRGDFEVQLDKAHNKMALENWELVTLTALPPIADNGMYLDPTIYPANQIQANAAVSARDRISFLATYRREKSEDG